MATPVKPVKNWYSSRVCGDLWYPGTDASVLKRNYDLGLREGHSHEPWTEIMSYPGTLRNGDAVKQGMRDAAKLGMNICLYSQMNISSAAPEFEEWGNEFSGEIPMMAGMTRSNPPQSIYGCCKASSWADFYVWKWTQMAKDWGVNGMYLDGTYAPTLCRNPYHSHAYIGSDGKTRLTNPIRAAREFMKRMVRSLRTVQPNFFFLNHGFYPFSSQFSNFGMSGEGFWFVPANTELSLDYIRAVYSRQWGTPMEFYPGPVLQQSYVLPLALAHGIGMWSPSGDYVAAFKTPVWQVWEKFGIEDASFVPYWRNSPLVTSSSSDIVATYYQKPHNVLLAVATNKRVKPSATVTLDLPGLGIDAKSLSIETGTGSPISASPDPDGKLRLKFPEQTNEGGYVWLRSE